MDRIPEVRQRDNACDSPNWHGAALGGVADLSQAECLIERIRLGERGVKSELTAVHIFPFP